MKKILTFLIGLILLSSVIAIDRTPVPRPFVVFVTYEGSPVEGIAITFSIDGDEVTKNTNEAGGVMVEADLGYSSDFPDQGMRSLSYFNSAVLTVSCGFPVCNQQYTLALLDYPYEVVYSLTEAPPEPEPECISDADCGAGRECINEECRTIPEPEPEPVEDKVNSNQDGTIALIESNFGDCVDVTITDSKLSKLFDGTIDFDTEDYDTHEELRVSYCIKTSLDDSDFGLSPYVIIEGEKLEYRYVFDDAPPLSEIERDEELEINFLGEDIEIISLSSSKMTIRHGDVFLDIKEGDSIQYEGLPLKVSVIDSDFVYVTYNGDSEKIYEDEIGEVGGIQVFVDEAVPNEDGDDLASLRIAIDIEEVIDDGDEFNSEWDYSIRDGYIGIRNSEEYRYLDEGLKPLTLGDKIVLPNDFAIIKVNEITTSDITEVDIRVRDSYLNVLGDREDGQDDSFSFGSEEYDRLYVDDTGIYDEDKILITTTKVRIGESDVYLEKGSIIIGDLEIQLGLVDILFKGISFAGKDDNYLTYDGIVFKNPDNAVGGSTFKIEVPDEVPEVTVTVGAESETIGVEPEPCPVQNRTVCTQEECESTICTPCPSIDCPSTYCPPPEECPEIPFRVKLISIIYYFFDVYGYP